MQAATAGYREVKFYSRPPFEGQLADSNPVDSPRPKLALCNFFADESGDRLSFAFTTTALQI